MVNLQFLGITFIVDLVVGAIMLHIATSRIVKIDGATFMKALYTALAAAIIVLVLSVISPVLGIIALIITIFLIKYFYNTMWMKALITGFIYLAVSNAIDIMLGALGFSVIGVTASLLTLATGFAVYSLKRRKDKGQSPVPPKKDSDHLPPVKLTCPVCRNNVERTWVFCPYCWARFHDDTRFY